jgi:hypothetical protein
MQIKKVFNLEEDLTSDEFIATKQDMVSEQCQVKHPNMLCKITTYCVKDKKFVIHTTEENRVSLGAIERLLAHRPMANESLMYLDNEMTNTWEINITANTTLPDYVTALNVAQAKVDDMFQDDKTRLPIVTVVDYRWGNPVTQIVPTIFSEYDEVSKGYIPPLQPMPIMLIGDAEKGRFALSTPSERILARSKEIFKSFDIDYSNFRNFVNVEKLEDQDVSITLNSGTYDEGKVDINRIRTFQDRVKSVYVVDNDTGRI